MKAKHVSDFNARTAAMVDYKLKEKNFQENVLDVQTDNTLDPSATPSDGDRYVIEAAAQLHANFGTIEQAFTGYDQNGNKTFAAAVLGDDDIVEYMPEAASGNGAFVIVLDVSATAENAMTINEADNHLYSFVPGTGWSDQGAAFEPSFTEEVFDYSPASNVAADTEHSITLPSSRVTKAGFPVQVSIEGVVLKSVDTTVSGVEGYSHVVGTGTVKVRAPYTILTTEVVRIVYKY